MLPFGLVNRFTCSALALVLLSCSCGCRSHELTRSRAKEIINSSKAFSDPSQHANYTLSGEDIQRGITAGYWHKQRGWFGDVLMLTASGKTLFLDFGSQGFGQSVTVTTKGATRRLVVEVTGITEAPALLSGGATPNSVKAVEFIWNWDDSTFPNALKTYLNNQAPASGTAILRLYDDGWRFESIH